MALLEADVNYKSRQGLLRPGLGTCHGAGVMESLTPRPAGRQACQRRADQPHGRQRAEVPAPEKQGPDRVDDVRLQGNGKTTHAAKLGKYYRSQGRRPLLVACDIYRPAAIEQLKSSVSRPVSRSLRWAPKSPKSSRRRHLPTRRITAMTLLFSIPQAVCRSMTSSWMSWCASSRLSRSMKRCWSWTPWPVRTPSMWPRPFK